MLGVLRIVRLTRVLRLLKLSKSLSGIVVLVRTVAQSGAAMMLILTFAILNCVLWASLMMATPEVGKYSQQQVVYLRENGSPSPFAAMFEVWWWCLQTLTSEGYGAPWVPINDIGKLVAIVTALVGTVILALPIAVVGLTFDEEWNKQAKADQFQVSRLLSVSHSHALTSRSLQSTFTSAAIHHMHVYQTQCLLNRMRSSLLCVLSLACRLSLACMNTTYTL